MAREMKNSGVKWIGDIPSEWVVSKIKYHCAMQSGDNLTSNDIESEGEYAVYGANGFRGYYNQFNCEGTHILIGRQGALAGNVHIVDGKYWATDHAVVTKITDSTNEKFLYYSLISANLNQYAFVTAAQPGLAVSVIINKSIPIPPLPEQQAIAEFLDVKCAEIDGLLADLDAEVKTLAEYKKSIIAETVTRGLKPNVPMKQSGIPWAEAIPVRWTTEKGKYLFELRRTKGNPHNLELMSPTQKFGVIPQSQLEGVVLVKEKTDLNTFRTIRPGDFCISLRSFQGGFEYSKYEGVVSPAYQVFFSIKPIVDGYFKYMFKSDGFISYINTFSMSLRDGKNIAFEDFGNSYIPVPSLDEQQAIASYLDEKCAIIDQSIADKQTQIETLKSYKASLIYEYVTGKKQVI